MFNQDLFKNDGGKVKTKTLFYEIGYELDSALFTIKEEDIVVEGKHLVSLYKLYMALVPQDPTEYTFAKSVFNSWEIWTKVANSVAFRGYVKEWRKEIEVRIKSDAIKAIAEEMKSGGRSSFSAAKLLLEKGWIDKEPSSAAKKKLQQKEDEETSRAALSMLQSDAERLGLKIN